MAHTFTPFTVLSKIYITKAKENELQFKVLFQLHLF